MPRLIAFTQYNENYGDEENPYWKVEGGSKYVVAQLEWNEAAQLGQEGMQKLVDEARSKVDYENPMFEEYIVDWELVEDHTEYETQQLEYDGSIIYPARKLSERKEAVNA